MLRHAPLLASALLLAGCGAGTPPAVTAAESPGRPNIIVVLLDDADVEITESMPRLRSLLIDKGARFTSHVANTPLCGPARAVLLTGQYAHNNKVYYNNGPEGGYTPWLAGGYDDRNIGPWLRAAGYRTGLFGKYMNDFPLGREETFVPKGWDDFRGVMSDREARNNRFTLNENGALKLYEAETGGYQTDLLGARLQDFILASEARDDQPFFAFLSLSSPHVPIEPAARHREAFPGEKAPRKPSYDESDLSDKPERLREQATPLTPAIGREIDATYRGMRQSMLAVEDVVESMFKTLAETSELSNTWVFLTSDNGWFRGEHRIPAEKYAPYEESIRVPLIVVGPGVPAGRTVTRPAGLVDLAPTLLELAGAPRALLSATDGRSLLPLLGAADPVKASWRESILIEHFGGGAPFRVRSYSGIRSASDVYVEYANGEREYYDLLKDPHQMENAAPSLAPPHLERLKARVAALKNCKAASCRSAEGSAQ